MPVPAPSAWRWPASPGGRCPTSSGCATPGSTASIGSTGRTSTGARSCLDEPIADRETEAARREGAPPPARRDPPVGGAEIGVQLPGRDDQVVAAVEHLDSLTCRRGGVRRRRRRRADRRRGPPRTPAHSAQRACRWPGSGPVAPATAVASSRRSRRRRSRPPAAPGAGRRCSRRSCSRRRSGTGRRRGRGRVRVEAIAEVVDDVGGGRRADRDRSGWPTARRCHRRAVEQLRGRAGGPGTRSPTVSRPPVTTSSTRAAARDEHVSGPGQHVAASVAASRCEHRAAHRRARRRRRGGRSAGGRPGGP